MNDVKEHFDTLEQCIVTDENASGTKQEFSVSFSHSMSESEISESLEYAEENGFVAENRSDGIYTLRRDTATMINDGGMADTETSAVGPRYARILIGRNTLILVLFGLVGGYAYQTLDSAVRETIRFTAYGGLYALAFGIGLLTIAALVELVEVDW